MSETPYIIANIFFGLGSILLIKDVIKDRSILRGYSWIGSLLTALGLVSIMWAYYESKFWTSMLIGGTQTIYWILVFVYVTQIRIREGKQE